MARYAPFPRQPKKRSIGRRCAKSSSTRKPPVSSRPPGHRVIEIGCVELVNRRPTQNRFHRYINPEREVDAARSRCTASRTNSSRRQPKFADVAAEFVEFVSGAELVIHNADFDIEFLNHELKRLSEHAASNPRLLRSARHTRARAAAASGPA